jgi:hypothetical protein
MSHALDVVDAGELLGEESPERVDERALAGGLLDSLSGQFGAAPWWVISGAFHGLLLLLVTLISMAMVHPLANDVIVTTSLEKAMPPEYDEKKPRDVFKNQVESPEDLPPTEHPMVTHEEVEVADHNETADEMDNASAKGDSADAISDVPLGGVGFVASIGLGGGGGGKFGQRSGGGRRRLVAVGGGGKATESAVEAALRWLARHQEADGHWDSQKYGADKDCDIADTGFALLAFLGAGHTEKVGQYKDNVRRAVAWLKAQQNGDGRFSANGYQHAIAAMGMAEAAGMGNIPDTKTAAQKAVDYSTNIHQSGEGYDKRGWRYSAKSAGDLSVTGWFVMQLKSAKVAGLNVDHQSFEGAIRFLDSCEKKGEGGDKGYGPASVYSYTPDGGHGGVRVTAIGNLCRQFLGWKKEDLQASVQWFMDKGGVPDSYGDGKTDLYYWYYGTLCTFQQGGDIWKTWNEAMKKTLCGAQRRGGDEDGSWDPAGHFADRWGRVGQTAIGALCLEVYYRYLPMYK